MTKYYYMIQSAYYLPQVHILASYSSCLSMWMVKLTISSQILREKALSLVAESNALAAPMVLITIVTIHNKHFDVWDYNKEIFVKYNFYSYKYDF